MSLGFVLFAVMVFVSFIIIIYQFIVGRLLGCLNDCMFWLELCVLWLVDLFDLGLFTTFPSLTGSIVFINVSIICTKSKYFTPIQPGNYQYHTFSIHKTTTIRFKVVFLSYERVGHHHPSIVSAVFATHPLAVSPGPAPLHPTFPSYSPHSWSQIYELQVEHQAHCL